ncbi:MAG: transporter [Hyphomicrobium zavarzinii]|uniref:SphA family protein n=1 Tax=Hyphomicrobium zavarzinii TaxID=48292 RepID=UPI001A5F145E|nr:transporter [Hyphomicrobium zavarzinii]MBL8846184.1 transporter [Hyphomicrobium zavarzinii]
MALRTKLLALTAIAAAAIQTGGEARSAENATGFYLLGSKTAMGGYVPPPGTYLTDINYYYSGEAGGAAAVGIALRQTGALLNIEANVHIDADAYINAPFALWIAPEKIAGGNVGFGVMVPVGRKAVDVGIDTLLQVTLPSGRVLDADRHFDLDDASTKFGDPVLNALIGWHEGNWHWTVGALLNVPIGPWESDSISNLSFNRWALDTTAAITWLDPAKGTEISVAAGFTFNGENPDTDYKTGTEFHVEWALMQHLSKTSSIGIGGYHYQQVTGDSGSGARLGDFEGRVTAIGPVLNHTFTCGKIPISTQLEWMHEFDAENRAEGDSAFLNVTIPLSVAGP